MHKMFGDTKYNLEQSFSTTAPWHQLYQAARGSHGSCHFILLSIFYEYIFYNENILRRIIFVNVLKSSFH